MSRQITILVMIDMEAAFAEGTLDGNVYMMDSEQAGGSTGEGTGFLTTVVGNGVLADGSQSEGIVLNWCVDCIATLPATLPRFYAEHVRRKKRSEAIAELINDKVCTDSIKKLRSAEDTEEMFSPYLFDITGEAVDKGIIFPAQYGTPVPVHGGWYWSASADTSRPGVYRYVMHLELYRRNGGKTETMRLAHEAAVMITNAPQRNGFTGAGLGFLPVCSFMNADERQKGEKGQ